MAPQASKQPDDTPELYESGYDWRLIEKIVGVVILLCIIGFFVWYLFFSSSNTPTATIGQTSGQNQLKDSSGSAAPTQNGSTSASGAGSGSSSSSGSSQGVNSNASTGQSNLTNTGPGDTIALFVGVVVISSLVYKIKFSHK